MTDNGANNLRVAIVEQAIIDYQRFYMKTEKLKQLGKKDTQSYVFADKELKDAERFLKSPWSRFILDLDGDYIIKTIRNICDTGKKKYARKTASME